MVTRKEGKANKVKTHIWVRDGVLSLDRVGLERETLSALEVATLPCRTDFLLGETFIEPAQATCPNPVGQREVNWSQASTAPLAGCSYNHTHKPGSCTPLPRGLQEVKSLGREGNGFSLNASNSHTPSFLKRKKLTVT